MKLFRVVALAFLAGGSLHSFASTVETNAESSQLHRSPSQYAVEIFRYDWLDAERDRKVPVKIYAPKGTDGPYPVIIFSHGLGGSRETYEYLGRHWASCGYISVHLQHLGSDNAVWEGLPRGEAMENMRKAAVSVANITNRPMDVTFAINQLEKLNKADGPFKRRLDLSKIGVAGHSFGAFTTLAVAGETFVTPFGKRISVLDPRIKAAIPMSSPVQKNKAFFDEAYRSIKIPCLHMTGTDDFSPIGQTSPKERRIPFDHSCNSDQFLITFKDGDHMTFSGRGKIGNTKRDDELQKMICIGSTAFWDAYLTGDPSAKAWFTDGSFERVLGGEGKFEKKMCLENASN